MEKQISVLLVDDAADVVESMKDLLELEGFRVTAATSGTGALEKVSENSYDLVFLDYKMPGLDGIETLKQLPSRLPVIMISAYGDREVTERALKHGAKRCIAKPFRIEDLLKAVRSTLS